MTEERKPGRPKDLVTRKYVQVRLSEQEEAELKKRGGSKWLQQILSPAKTVTSEKKKNLRLTYMISKTDAVDRGQQVSARAEALAAMQARLASAGLAYESISVFGAVRCNVQVRCVGRDTADKWAALLGLVFKGAKVYIGPHRWPAAKNKNTCLRPTMRHGYLVTVAA